MNSKGKVLTIFLVIMAILLVSLTAISMFFFQKEIEKREYAETQLKQSVAKGVGLEAELVKVKKQTLLLEEKNKEADERINSLLDELELEEGLREEIKLERNVLKDELAKGKEDKIAIQKELNAQIGNFKEKVVQLEEKLKLEISLKEGLKEKISKFEQKAKELEVTIVQLEQNKVVPKPVVPEIVKPSQIVPAVLKESEVEDEEVDLEKIVVIPIEVPEGRILSVDKETGFVIINLGEKDGVLMGSVMSVYRGKDYLGDIKVSRIQPEMAAADLLPPFSSRLVRKNDQVVVK
ncbi:MAG: hypothetical protein KKD07_02320 [Candidatus Omnitrophica bacterium]|nr:hypothetical protein [Candidatus Omnitrophota bacterium]MBU1997624.1 hypothetical protein [Candidatus Omnitrophota bacterium]MBU4333256.1 hypothetical protein [Candidatus Omnitrophota bacterium]